MTRYPLMQDSPGAAGPVSTVVMGSAHGDAANVVPLRDKVNASCSGQKAIVGMNGGRSDLCASERSVATRWVNPVPTCKRAPPCAKTASAANSTWFGEDVIRKVLLAMTPGVFEVDALEIDAQLWLVPQWIREVSSAREGGRAAITKSNCWKPAYLLKIDWHEVTRMGDLLVVDAPMPTRIFRGKLTPNDGHEIRHSPDVQVCFGASGKPSSSCVLRVFRRKAEAAQTPSLSLVKRGACDAG